MKNVKKGLMSLALFFLLGITAGCAASTVDAEENKEATIEQAIPIKVKPFAHEQMNEKIFTFGYLEASDTYIVTPYSTGIVDEIMVEVGDYVEEGDLLFQLSAQDLELSQDRDLLSGKSNINSSKANLDAQAMNLSLRESDVELREMSLLMAKENYENTLTLFDNGIASQSELTTAKNNYDQASISYNQSVTTLESTKISYSSAKTSYNEALKNYEYLEESYGDKKEDLFVLAPISGLITNVDVQKDIMNNGSKGVTISNENLMHLDVEVLEKYIHDVEIGQKVELSLDYEDRVVVGEVTNISLTSTNGYYPVEITIDNSSKTLNVGMYMEGYIKTETKNNLFKVDKSLLFIDDEGRNYIYIVDQEQMTASKVLVETGIEEDGYVEIIGDINAGDQLITLGYDYVDDGQLVSIK